MELKVALLSLLTYFIKMPHSNLCDWVYSGFTEIKWFRLYE